jgi:hypothetical protein
VLVKKLILTCIAINSLSASCVFAQSGVFIGEDIEVSEGKVRIGNGISVNGGDVRIGSPASIATTQTVSEIQKESESSNSIVVDSEKRTTQRSTKNSKLIKSSGDSRVKVSSHQNHQARSKSTSYARGSLKRETRETNSASRKVNTTRTSKSSRAASTGISVNQGGVRVGEGITVNDDGVRIGDSISVDDNGVRIGNIHVGN